MTIDAQLRRARELLGAGDLSAAADLCLAVLRLKPDHVPAIELYGELAERMRRFDDAMLIYQKLLKAEPHNIVAHEQLAQLYFEEGDRYHAVGHARRALELNPSLVSPYVVLGSLALFAGDRVEGEAHFASAIARSADHNQVNRAMASALRAAGDFEDCTRLLRELIRSAPDEAQYHEMLSLTSDLASSEEDARLIESLCEDSGDLRPSVREPGERSLSAYMALSRLHAARGDYPASFSTLEKAKEIRRAASPYDPHSARDNQARFHAVFNEAFADAHREVGCDADEALFLIGMPRSGTTLLERLLASSEIVSAAGELPIAERLLYEACAAAGAHQNDYAALAGLSAEHWRQLGEEYIRRARQQSPRGRYFVDKSPGNTFILGFIRTMLPRARIIHSVRHPVATCFSIYEQNFLYSHEYANDLVSLGEQYLLYREVMAHWRRLYPGDIVDVHYEELVSDAQKTLSELHGELALSEVTFDLAPDKRLPGEIRTASVWQARQEIHTRSVNRWENYRDELRALTEVLEPLLRNERESGRGAA